MTFFALIKVHTLLAIIPLFGDWDDGGDDIGSDVFLWEKFCVSYGGGGGTFRGTFLASRRWCLQLR